MKIDDEPTKKDKNYRRYASAVERALSLFDTALQEWADYISFLSRLLKALQSRPTAVAEVPHKFLVTKRLAQCLNPSLPSGVHQKTIEIYTYIFALLGKDGLERDLPLYLPGLSSTLTFASLSIRPALLSLFEKYVLALDGFVLRPALKAIILALLPGLEDESSEEFEHVHALLARFKSVGGSAHAATTSDAEAASEQFFWQCFFLASITSSSRRPGALAFLSRHLPKLGNRLILPQTDSYDDSRKEHDGSNEASHQATEAVITPEPGLLIRCFESGLRDEQILIQRGFLDLLVTHLPLDSIVLHGKITPEDAERLVAAAASVVSRRDISLNRRLWTWLLGPGHSAEFKNGIHVSPQSPMTGGGTTNIHFQNEPSYFRRFALKPLVCSILKMIETRSTAPSDKIRPFRICLSLMDRSEIGEVVVPRLFLPLLESACQYQKSAPSQKCFEEVLRSANVFFDGVESGLIWGEVFKVLHTSFHEEVPSGDAQRRIDLILFLITRFNVRDEEMQMIHMPLITLMLVIYLRKCMPERMGHQVAQRVEIYATALRITLILQDLIPKRAYAASLASENLVLHGESSDLVCINQTFLNKIQEFYVKYHGSVKLVDPLSSSPNIGEILLKNTILLILQNLINETYAKHIDLALSIFDKVIRKVPVPEHLEEDKILSVLYDASVSTNATDEGGFSITPITAIVSVLETFSTAFPSFASLSNYKTRQLIPNIMSKSWSGLSPSKPECNVEAARCIWRLHVVLSCDKTVEGALATLLSSNSQKTLSESKLESARRFVVLWTHSITSSGNFQSSRSNVSRKQSQRLENRTEECASAMDFLGRPLLLLLDSLLGTKTDMSIFVSRWLQSLPNIRDIIKLLVSHTTMKKRWKSQFMANPSAFIGSPFCVPNDVEECLYYLQLIAKVMICSPSNSWVALATAMENSNTEQDSKSDTRNESSGISSPALRVHDVLAHICLNILGEQYSETPSNSTTVSVLRQVATTILQQMLLGPFASLVLPPRSEDIIIKALNRSIELSDNLLQVALMDLITSSLRARPTNADPVPLSSHRRIMSGDTLKSLPRLSFTAEASDRDDSAADVSPPPTLFDCLLLGFSSPKAYSVLDHWVQFLDECLPFYAGTIFQVLMPLVDSLSRAIISVFSIIQASFKRTPNSSTLQEPLASLISLLNGLERVLARAHERLVRSEPGTTLIKTPEQSQGFFGNIVSGVFPAEANKSRSTSGNNRLTVLLCIKDAVRVCLEIWTWGGYEMNTSLKDHEISASINYTSIRLKNRTRRILEHLFGAETLECLESLVEIWQKPDTLNAVSQASTVLDLLHVLDGSKPKNTIPAIFNAMYSRTNPAALEPGRKSSLTSDLSDVNLAAFLVAYVRSLEDDTMDEIWSDCMTFLRDVLANPLPHRQTVPRLLEFTAILGQKVDNTNFGEQRRMRRDLGDLFVRLLAATFTLKPLSFASENSQLPPVTRANPEAPMNDNVHTPKDEHDDIIAILAAISPKISKTLIDSDRVAAACSTISAQVLAPTFRSRTFPKNVTARMLELLHGLSRVPEASKTWRKDVAEAFNDTKFFSLSSVALVEHGWLPVLRQWELMDKDRVPEILSRIPPPASAGIVFGVGASTARSEADRKTQLNLRRLALLLLAAAEDNSVANLNAFQEKLSELLTATTTSSPSSNIRAEVYMLIRALVLKTSPIHLASFWPMINSELYDTISSLFPREQHESHNSHCTLQACKLLDTLIVLAPDEFQQREWLFITDTIDAVYRPPGWEPLALVDELVEDLDSKSGLGNSISTPTAGSLTQNGKRRPLLSRSTLSGVRTTEAVDHVLRQYFRQLSISAFESTYSMEAPDWKACYDELLHDLFDDSTIA